ncbi:MAG: ComF family protein [Bacteroidetes bacterium]|nr:MAG: ComF family protein [Bacteroidota bacterium]
MFQWIKDSINLVIPHTCASCHVILARPDAGLCIHCLNRIQALVKGCDHELTQRLGKHKSQVRRGYALMYFEQHGVSQHLIHKIKYHNGEHLATYWGRYLGTILQNLGVYNDVKSCLLIPVPMHKRRARRRGYNPPLHIAYGIQEVLGDRALVCNSVLSRVQHSKSQTSADFNQRYQRLTGSFQAYPLPGKPDIIILVDDVITSTSTIVHCAEALRSVFSKDIYATALAFAA